MTAVNDLCTADESGKSGIREVSETKKKIAKLTTDVAYTQGVKFKTKNTRSY